MEPGKISGRSRRQLDGLPPEKRAEAEAILARTRSPEYRAREVAQRDAIRRELLETGIVAITTAEELDGLKAFLGVLRREREAGGLSLSDLAERSGMDKAALSRLENCQQMNPTLQTLARYARALGKNLRWSLEDSPAAT